MTKISYSKHHTHSGPINRRSNIFKRELELGNYLIITDTQETEKNYFDGLRNSFKKEEQKKIRIKVKRAETTSIVADCMEAWESESNIAEPWIVFDKDRVPDFDKIISEAERKGIHVGWSNPCFETWMSMYFGDKNKYDDSQKCCREFSREYWNKLHREYKKDNRNIYDDLKSFGNEEEAIQRAENRRKSFEESQEPSQKVSCTTVDQLVSEIVKKRK